MDLVTSEETRNDGALVNVLTGLGIASRDKTTATSVGSVRLLGQSELEALYAHGVPRRYVDAIPDEILRHRPTITLGANSPEGDKELIPRFEETLKQLQIPQALAEVIKLQRLYGGACLVMLLDDGLEPHEPVDVKRLRGLRGVVPLSRHNIIPEDVNFLDYNRPTHYRITTSQRLSTDQAGTYTNLLIHSSRVCRFDGLYLPWNVRVTNTGWGQSVLQLIWEAYKRYESALSGLESMASDSDAFVHKIPGLFQRIAAGNESDLRKRLEASNLSRSVYGGLVIDTEEDVNFLSRNLTNLASATEPFVKDLQAATGWPASILMGDSPGGLGKEGRFEERVWSSLVEQWQEVYCRTAITELFTMVLASREGPSRGKVPSSWSVHFPSVFTQTDEEKAALRLNVAQVDAQYVNLGVLNAIEVRQSRFGGTEFSIETQLTEAVSEQMAMQADAQFEATMQGYAGQAAAAAAPPEEEEVPPEDAPAEEAPPEDAPPENAPPRKAPAAKPRGDASPRIDAYAAHGLRIRVTHSTPDGVRAGPLIAATGVRVDASAPFVVFGPSRVRGNLHRATLLRRDGSPEGVVYTAGFNTLRLAKQSLATLFPQHNVAALQPVPEGDAAALREVSAR